MLSWDIASVGKTFQSGGKKIKETVLGQKLFLHRYFVFWTTRDAVWLLFYVCFAHDINVTAQMETFLCGYFKIVRKKHRWNEVLKDGCKGMMQHWPQKSATMNQTSCDPPSQWWTSYRHPCRWRHTCSSEKPTGHPVRLYSVLQSSQCCHTYLLAEMFL